MIEFSKNCDKKIIEEIRWIDIKNLKPFRKLYCEITFLPLQDFCLMSVLFSLGQNGFNGTLVMFLILTV
jgi:hypothetical protein